MSVGLLMPIKDRLKELRKAAGMTQQGLAVAAGLSMSVVIHLEAGRIKDPRALTLLRLAKALGCGLDDLVGEDDLPPADEPPAKGKGKPKK